MFSVCPIIILDCSNVLVDSSNLWLAVNSFVLDPGLDFNANDSALNFAVSYLLIIIVILIFNKNKNKK